MCLLESTREANFVASDESLRMRCDKTVPRTHPETGPSPKPKILLSLSSPVQELPAFRRGRDP